MQINKSQISQISQISKSIKIKIKTKKKKEKEKEKDENLNFQKEIKWNDRFHLGKLPNKQIQNNQDCKK